MTDAKVADSLVGTLVDGRYRVRDRIARGGMATVYAATDERLDRPVALKMVHTVQPDERVVGRFVDEAKAIARLTHPNVVAAYDQGSHDGAPYLVMEYVQGRTLREILNARRRLTPVEALAITEQMLSAIAAAHRAGLVHRDVKPENVLVAESPSGGSTNLVDCVVKVTDFGLAQAVQASASTENGLLATAAYVAPELVTEGRADPRSDVYSTGIVLFEMLTGRVPFDGPDPAEVAWRHVEEEVPPPSRYVAGLPYAVDNLAIWATRREQALRPSDAGVLLNDVQAVREKVTTSASRRSPVASSDATVQMPAVRGGPERPAWSRLPGPRTRTLTGPSRPRSGRHGPGDALRRRRAVLAAFGAVLLLLLAIGGWWFGIGRWTPAPDLVGLPEAEAVAAAQERGLTVRFADPEYDEQVPAGHVLEQDPETRVIRGGTITLTLSRGPEVHPVPDVIGASLEVAIRRLQELELVVVEGEPEYSNTVPEGRVLSVEPAVGTEVRPGTEVTVVASRGRAPITVPTVTDKHVDQATAELQALGLQVTVTESEERDRPQGTVVAQDPAAGSGVEPGATVTLEVSPGPPVTPVPEVTGQECQQARQILEQAGFRVRFGFGEDGFVRLQNPSAGTGLPAGSEVTIFCQR